MKEKKEEINENNCSHSYSSLFVFELALELLIC